MTDRIVGRVALQLQSALASRPVPPLVIVIGLGRGDLLRALETSVPLTRGCWRSEPQPCSSRRRSWPGASGTAGARPAVSSISMARSTRVRARPGAPLPTIRTITSSWRTRAGAGRRDRSPSGCKDAQGNRLRRPRQRPGAAAVRTALSDSGASQRASYLAGHNVPALRDAYRGRPAVVAAAGPSLDAAVSPLRDLEGRALLVAADTALRPLLTAASRLIWWWGSIPARSTRHTSTTCLTAAGPGW